MKPEDEAYFERLEAELDEAFEVAKTAKQRGEDPKPAVEIPTARDMADRVENILGIDGVAERVRELEGEFSREEAALELVEDFVEGRVGSYEGPEGKIEGAVRTAVALLTEGVVAAPIEGIDRVVLEENDDGTEYVRVAYAGPIRSAGGTAQALSVLVADYARSLLDVDEFKPRDEEVERYAEEVQLYDAETGLQYTPKDEETKFITKHCPVMLDGEATSDEEVSGFRDLERIDTNAARGGMCLVLAEGIALKAPKIQRYTRDLAEVEWPWLQDLIDGTIGKDDGDDADEDADGDVGGDGADDADGEGDESEADEAEGPPRADGSEKFLRDLIAGRPVFGHSMEPGGFRLRYGRTRNLGHATAGVHPATMRLVDDFLAPGTQIKTELPGKAAGVVPADSVEGPTVRLANGDVRRIDDEDEALELRNGVEAVLDLGEYLVNYGEFVENNHPLAPAAYAVEWWTQDLAAAGADVQALRDDPAVDLAEPDPETAVEWAREHDAPLHPAHTHCWHDLDVESFEALADAVADGRIVHGDGASATAEPSTAAGGDLVLDRDDAVRSALEALLVEHHQGEAQLTVPTWRPLALCLGLTEDLERTWDELSAAARSYGEDEPGDNAMRAVNEVAPFEVREKAPTRVGCRMGRPEKSEDRELSPAVHALYPIGDAGGDQRDVAAATHHADSLSDAVGEVPVEVGVRRCDDCDVETHRARCPDCGEHVEPHYTCPDCDRTLEPDEAGRVECPRCEVEGDAVEERLLDVASAYRDALEAVGEREHVFDVLKGVKGLSSELKTPEPLEKGVLRAKHGVSAFKDGTVRYDMTDLPVTAVKPAELDVTVDQLHALGYEEDVHGDPLRHDDQVVELKVQDVVLSHGAAEHMLKTADFVDDLLASYYDLDPYYELEERDDLVGELVFGMAPHTSAAVVGRVVGFADVAAGYAHPYFHAAKRRNCFHPDTKIWYEDETGESHYGRIEAFVEERLDDPRADDFGTLVEDLDGEVRVPSVERDGSRTVSPVTAVSKHPAPDHLVRIETESGRSITVTPDHTMLRWHDGHIEDVRATELTVGDDVPAVATDPTTPAASDSSAIADGGRPHVDTVARVELVPSTVDYTYCVTVDETHRLAANGLHAGQCDGDEDCVMLLLDGLLNFSKTYLPDQRGGSVAEDSRLVAVDPEGNVRFTTFDEFWDELDTEVVRDGKFRKKPCLAEGWKTYAFDDEHRATLRPIEKAIRYQADEDEELLRVRTQFGRSIEITDCHSLFRYDDGIEEVAGDDLSEGDLLVAPQELDVDAERTTIDVPACLDDPYVFIDEDVEAFLTDVWESTPRGGDVHAAFDSGLSYRLSKGKISLDRLEQIAAEANEEPPLRDATIGLWGSETGIDPTIDVDAEFAWLLGMFVAEGSLAGDSPTLFNSDEELIDRVVDVAERTIGVEPAVEWSNKSYRVHFPAVFRSVLFDLGFQDRNDYSSSEKVVPEPILRADREVVLEFLRGLLAGDGSETTNDNHTTLRFHTTSEDVKDGVVFLLHRLGLVANVSSKERDESRQPIYEVAVSGGASSNPLRAILDGEDPYQPKSLVVRIPDALMDLREMPIPDVKDTIPKYLKRRQNVSLEKLEEIVDTLDGQDLSPAAEAKLDELRPLVDGDLAYLRIEEIERVDYDGYLYDLQVGGDPIFTANWLYAHNSMDAPLVMSSRIDPEEIDDEAHNVDVVDRYPREFYEATRELADPEDVDVEIVEDSLGTDEQYSGFGFTHATTSIASGPDLSAYKTLESMMDKMDAQLELARTLRSVDEVDVAERVIEYHFLPDLIGNLRAFSRQEVRCLDCGEKFRRPPLSRDCRECGGDVTLTVHEGSVNKYMETAMEVAEEYGARKYTKQRLEVLDRSIRRIFENDKNKASSLDDFM